MSSIKIAANMSAVAHHIIDGAVTFPYAIDAHSAVSRFPDEWSHTPWSLDAVNRARSANGAPEVEMTAEERAAVEEHAKAVEAANERLKAFHEKKAAERAEAEQVAADEAMVKSAPPAVTGKRPFGRPGEPTAAELELMRRRDEKKASDEKMVREKAEADRIGAAEAGGAKLTT